MLSRQISEVPSGKKANAPYNFVELPNKAIAVGQDFLPKENSYVSQSSHRYTGRITCQLTTKSPLYIRCGLTPEDYVKYGEKSDRTEKTESLKILSDFSYEPINKRLTLFGSSLRGMIRAIVEIVSFGKVERVSDQQRFFYRAVAAKKDDPLGGDYKKLLKNVQAGYLIQQGSSWYIQPAKKIARSPFIWVKERNLFHVSKLIKMNQPSYRPQYIKVSFGDTYVEKYRTFTREVNSNLSVYPHQGVLVTSGNMLEASGSSDNLNRKNHCIIAQMDENEKQLKISDDAVRSYCNALTDFQQEEPFDEKLGILEDGRPIFYCKPQNGQSEVTLFGHCPNFRIPYTPNQDGKIASAVDFIPKSISNCDEIDLADAIFGFVRTKNENTTTNSQSNQLSALAGRIFVEDAICTQKTTEDIWLAGNSGDVITPKILSTPKPTTFQHYLVQKNAEKSQLKHYGSKPPTDTEPGETVIRGHKLYWHKPNVGRKQIEEGDRDKIDKARSQYTDIKPIKAGVGFDFTIHFENLRDVELGALLWVLDLAEDREKRSYVHRDEEYCFSLGMGKPLGMGSVKITHELYLSDRQQRYSKLFNENQWLTGEEEQKNTTEQRLSCVKAFEDYIIKNIHPDDRPKGHEATKLEELPRIQMLLAMLLSDRTPDIEETGYMTIEPDNEYINRPVLPTPLQIVGWEDRRKVNSSPTPRKVENKHTTTSTQPSESSKATERPILKNNKPRKNPPDNSSGSNPDPLARPPKLPKS